MYQEVHFYLKKPSTFLIQKVLTYLLVDALMKFNEVAQTFEEIEKVSGRLEITRLFADLLKKATAHEASIICTLSLGLLRPPYQGTQFNFAEKNMVEVIAQVLEKPETTIIAQSQKTGDLGTVLAEGEGEWQVKQHLTIEQVYAELCDLEKVGGAGAHEEKVKRVLDLLKKLEPTAGKYVVRIILGTLRLGFSDMTIIDALSWMETGDKSLRTELEDAYNVCADIGLIAETLKDKGIKAIKHMQVQVGIPLLPAF